jgi:hypothetical protein
MAKAWAVIMIVAAFLLVAPVIEYGAVESNHLFTAIGNADGGAGGD